MYDEWMMNREQKRKEREEELRELNYISRQGGVIDLALLPFSIVGGILVETLKLVLEKRAEMEQTKAEAKCLEELILDATARAQPGKIVPLEELLGGVVYGRDDHR